VAAAGFIEFPALGRGPGAALPLAAGGGCPRAGQVCPPGVRGADFGQLSTCVN